MRKKQIEMLFNIYEKIESDNEIIEKTLEILNPGNYNFSGYGVKIFNSLLEIIKIEDEVLHSWLEYFCYETGLGKDKLNGKIFKDGKVVKKEPSDHHITTNGKDFIFKNKEDCINFLLENNYITN